MKIYVSRQIEPNETGPNSIHDASLEEISNEIKIMKHQVTVNEIKKETDEAAIKLKKLSMGIFFPGYYNSTTSKLPNDIIPTGIIQLDIDKKHNLGLDIEKYKNEIITQCSEIRYCFLSPRGGLKIGIQSDFSRGNDESIESLKNRYVQASIICHEYIQNIYSGIYDESAYHITLGCFMSADNEAFYNNSSAVFNVNNLTAFNLPSYIPNTSLYVTDEEALKMLACCPRTLSYHERRNINFACFGIFGEAATNILMNHWDKPDNAKLLKQLESHKKYKKYGDIRHLYNVAVKYGYKNDQKWSKKYRAQASVTTLQPLMSIEEGTRILSQTVKDFFYKKESAHIAGTPGLGKTKEVIETGLGSLTEEDILTYNLDSSRP